MADRITHQARPLDFLITSLCELHLRKTFEMVDTRSNMQLSDLNSKPHGGKSLRNLINHAIVVRFYPTPGSLRYQQFCLGQCHEPTHINCGGNKKIEITKTKISSAHNCTTKSCIDQI